MDRKKNRNKNRSIRVFLGELKSCDGGRDDNSAPPELMHSPSGVLHWTSVASFRILEDSAEIKETRKVDQLGQNYLCLANDFLTNWSMC